MHHPEPVPAVNAVANAAVNRGASEAAGSDARAAVHRAGAADRANPFRRLRAALASALGLAPRRRARRDPELLHDDPYAAYLRWKRGCADGLAPEAR